jgi:drug/metabolite transporter (DMT)-like permease
MEPFLWITLAASIVYTLATLCMKRSSSAGIGPWRTTVIWNALLALIAFPMWFVGESSFSWSSIMAPILISFGFFLGQLFNALAIHRGEVSVVTPIMSTKVVFVSILAVFFLTDDMTATLWVGALLSTVAILIMRGASHTEKKRLLPSIILGLLSAMSFAGFDISIQRSGLSLGFAEIVSRTFTFAFLWSLLLIPFFKSSIQTVTRQTWTWLIIGGVLHSAQALVLAYVLSNFGNATRVNIVYSSRGFWSIVLVWIIGHWFGNFEKNQGGKVLIRRLIGSSLLGVAIVLATLD